MGRREERTDPRPPSVQAGLLILMALTVWIYAPVRSFEFVTWDDGPYVTENPNVLGGLTWPGVGWAATALVPYWHPVTWLSHMIDVQLFGTDAGAHHLVSLALHLLNTIVLFGLLRLLTGRPWAALLTAGLFAVHPLRVESVAWVAERKDLLSALFALLAIVAYTRYAASRSTWWYAAMVVSFATSLAAKPMFVTLPALLLLLDWWPLRLPLTARRLWEKAPLLLLSLGIAALTYAAQQQVGTMAGLARLSWGDRLANAAISCVSYLRKAVWPVDLAAFYPYPDVAPPGWLVGASVAALAGFTAAAWVFRRFRYLPFGWGWFLVVLLPVIGIVQVGNQAMADRFTYVSLVGVSVALVWGLADMVARYRIPPAGPAILAVTAIVVLATQSRVQVMTWSNSEALWSRVLAVSPQSFYAHSALGVELARRDDLAGARREQEEALRLRPADPDANNELGILLTRNGDFDAAIGRFERALAGNPSFEEARKNLSRAHFDRGSKFGEAGDIARALADFEAAVAGDGALPEYRVNAAIALISLGRRPAAIDQLRAALVLDRDNERIQQLLRQLETSPPQP